ncbi:MAG: hypothetical protein K2Q22_03590, partial [Cytophagales bacterium]|nr:hypothetical protein [Cytophagales bacterium]
MQQIGIIVFLGCFLALTPSITMAQKPKFSSSLRYIERLIEEKNLREAVPYNQTVLKRIKKKLGQNTPQFAQAFVNDCYLRTLYGQHDGVDEDLESIHNRVWTIFSDTGSTAFGILLRGADTYHEMGNYMAANRFLEKADLVLAKSKFEVSSNQMMAFSYRKAKNLNERGFYILARTISDSLIKVQEARLAKKETIKDANGNLKVVSISGKERRRRKEQYAEIIILNALTYLYEGN